MPQEATWNTHKVNFLSSLLYCNINIPFICSVIEYSGYPMAFHVTMKLHPPQLPFQMRDGAGGRRGDFASIPGDSLLGEVKNNTKKIKEIVIDARKILV
jgi:hypothetical protein